MVDEISDEFGDYRFMHPHGPANQLTWPAKEDTCWVGKSLICARLLLLLLPHHHLGNSYITGTDEENIAKVYPQWMTSYR